MNQTGGAGRIFGLDIMRASAVLLVLVGHSSAHFNPPAWFAWYWGAQGTLGVEIFYVLSGYLIGGILIRLARSGGLHSTAQVWNFWSRRWARTLPAYFFFLLLYLRYDYLGIGDLTKLYPFLFFMQNFAWPQMPFFQHSWSLAIEEWFYFLFPLMFLWLARDERAYRAPMLATCAVFILLPLLLRMAVASGITDYGGFNEQIRTVVLCRLDSIFIGVLLALIKTTRPGWYARLRWCGIPSVLLLLGVSIYLAMGLPGLFKSYWGMVLFFPLLSLLVAAGLPWLEGIRTLGWSWLDRFVTYTSVVSYSLYLGHIAMLSLVIAVIGHLGLVIADKWQTMLAYLACLLAFYAFATLTYLFVEQPFMRLRDVPKAAST